MIISNVPGSPCVKNSNTNLKDIVYLVILYRTSSDRLVGPPPPITAFGNVRIPATARECPEISNSAFHV